VNGEISFHIGVGIYFPYTSFRHQTKDGGIRRYILDISSNNFSWSLIVIAVNVIVSDTTIIFFWRS
jgi:hypothetical protein